MTRMENFCECTAVFRGNLHGIDPNSATENVVSIIADGGLHYIVRPPDRLPPLAPRFLYSFKAAARSDRATNG
jgi:hypothetical protein